MCIETELNYGSKLSVRWTYEISRVSIRKMLRRLIGAGSILLMGLNIVGAKETTRLQVAMVAGLLAILVFLVIKGAPVVDRTQYTPFAPNGWGAILPTAALVFISYIGLTKVASVAEEVKNPERNIPLGMFLSLITILVVSGGNSVRPSSLRRAVRTAACASPVSRSTSLESYSSSRRRPKRTPSAGFAHLSRPTPNLISGL